MMIEHDPKTALDDKLIPMNRPYEVRDWCKRLGCSKEELTRAVKTVGPSANKVREFLQHQTS